MKSFLFCWIVTALFFAQVKGQRKPITLSDFSKTRADHFRREEAKAKAFSSSTHKALTFTDKTGTHIRIVGVNEHGIPIFRTTLNADAAITTGAVQLRAGGFLGLNILGEGMLVGVWDAGLVKDHIELGQRVISKQGDTLNTHATHVTGTLIATGINPAAKGMAPLAEATTWYFDNDEAEMAALAKPDQSSLLLSNHSYGTATGWFKDNGVWVWTGDDSISTTQDYRFGFYGERAQVFDQLASLAPYYTIVWAAGNDRADVGDGSKPPDCDGGIGYDCIIPESVAKNLITVGAVNEVASYSGPSSVAMSFFSSWGPTDDGRIKPDMVGDGVNVLSLSAVGTNTYTTLSGTSMSTPNVAGSLLLLQELYSRLHAKNFMKSATLKALAIHTVKEAGTAPGPDYSFGWGLLDVSAAARLLMNEDDQNIFVQQVTLTNGLPYELDLNPLANQKITATIAWTDPAGTPVPPQLNPPNLMLVNDLDMRIVDGQGMEQFPWILDPANPSQPATVGDNFRDNIEKIEFNLPAGQPYKLTVTNKGTLVGGTQDFSLILSYQSTTPATTFYWVGGSGNWNDETHWSLTSGGPPAFAVPTSQDRVIADENSFDSLSVDTLSISQNVACSSLLWMNDRPAGVALNNNTMTIGLQFVIGFPSFFLATPGTIHLSSSSAVGTFQTKQADLSGATLIFDGTWNAAGTLTADELQLSSGVLTISNSTFSLERLVANSTVSQLMQLAQSKIYLTQSSTINGATITISSVGSSLEVSAPVVLQWQSVNFPGEIIVDPSVSLTTNGDNQIGKLLVQGTLQLNGTNQIDTLWVMPGSTIDLGSSTIQTLSSQTQISGDSLQSVTLSSAVESTLQFSERAKLCFDYLRVTNVDISGDAVVNAGLHSALVNASHWQQQDCNNVLFADFAVRYPCVNGMTELTNTSTGQIIQHSWRIGSLPLPDSDSTYTFTSGT